MDDLFVHRLEEFHKVIALAQSAHLHQWNITSLKKCESWASYVEKMMARVVSPQDEKLLVQKLRLDDFHQVFSDLRQGARFQRPS